MSIREAPTPTPDSEIRGSEAYRKDLTLRNAVTTPPWLEMRSGRDRKMSYNVAFCLGVQEIWVDGGLSGFPVLLFQDEEAGSHKGGKQCEWSRYQAMEFTPPSFLLPCLCVSS